MDCSLPGSSTHGIFQARVLSGVPLPSPLSLSNMQLNLSTEISVIDFLMTDFSNLKFPLFCSFQYSTEILYVAAQILEYINHS